MDKLLKLKFAAMALALMPLISGSVLASPKITLYVSGYEQHDLVCLEEASNIFTNIDRVNEAWKYSCSSLKIDLKNLDQAIEIKGN